MNPQSLIELKANRNIPDFRPGDTVRVHFKVVEGERERIQVFEGVVLRIRHRGLGSSFTVRRISHGVGVERIFPSHSPLIDKVEVSKVGKVRRAKLYYLRDRAGRSARVRAGDRARFEALTAALPPEEPEGEEEDVAPEGAEIEEGAEAAVEETEPTEGEAEATDGDAPAEEEVAEPEAKTDESAAEEEPAVEEPVAEEPAASEEPPAEEPAAAEETRSEEEPAAEETSSKEEPVAEESADEADEESSDEKPADGEADDSKE